MSIVVLQHSEHGRPGRLGLTLRDHGHLLDIRRLDLGEQVPLDFDGVDGVISLGGPQSAAAGQARPAWMEAEIDYLRRAHAMELPVVGVCLGLQLIAVALGGEVRTMAKPEVGFAPVSINPTGQTEIILAGVAWTSRQYCHHNDEVSKMPPGAAGLASSAACATQAFRAGMRTYAFQFHFEADREMVMAFARDSTEELERAGLDESAISRQVQEHYEGFARLANRLCLNMAAYLLPAPGLRQMMGGARSGGAAGRAGAAKG